MAHHHELTQLALSEASRIVATLSWPSESDGGFSGSSLRLLRVVEVTMNDFVFVEREDDIVVAAPPAAEHAGTTPPGHAATTAAGVVTLEVAHTILKPGQSYDGVAGGAAVTASVRWENADG